MNKKSSSPSSVSTPTKNIIITIISVLVALIIGFTAGYYFALNIVGDQIQSLVNDFTSQNNAEAAINELLLYDESAN